MVGGLRCIVIHVKCDPNRSRGYGAVGVENGPFLLLWPVAYTTACTTVQAVIVFNSSHVAQHSALLHPAGIALPSMWYFWFLVVIFIIISSSYGIIIILLCAKLRNNEHRSIKKFTCQVRPISKIFFFLKHGWDLSSRRTLVVPRCWSFMRETSSFITNLSTGECCN